MLIFLKLYLSHLIADFLLQPNRIAKKKRSAGALLAHSGIHVVVALVLAAKALVRYPEIKEDQKGHFAEYFLIGTLTSVSIALIGGLIARKFLSRF